MTSPPAFGASRLRRATPPSAEPHPEGRRIARLRRQCVVAVLMAVAGSHDLFETSDAYAAAPPCRYAVTASGTGNGTVRDIVTGLTWQQTPPSMLYAWGDAGTYCQQLSYGGFTSGWRLPTLKELLSTVDYAESNPAQDSTAFLPATTVEFWASTPYAGGIDMAWYVEFGAGLGLSDSTSTTHSARCVR